MNSSANNNKNNKINIQTYRYIPLCNYINKYKNKKPSSFTKMCCLLLPNTEKSVLFHLSDNSHRVFHISGRR